MNNDVAWTNKMHVQLDLARRKLHWASLTMDFSVPIAKLRKGMFCMLSAIFYGLFNPDRLI